MSIDDMDRRMAERHFRVRAERLKEELRSLPLPEKFRAVADFLDKGAPEWALSLARYALAELERGAPVPTEETRHPNSAP